MEGKRRKYNNGRRHSTQTKEKAREMRAKGFTHNEIVKTLGISLGSAHLWTANVKITQEQKEAIEKRRNQHAWTAVEKAELRRRMKIIAEGNRKYDRAILLKKIKSFYRKNGRIPLKREFNMWREYRQYFLSWNDAITAAGFVSNNVIFSKRFLSSDGHVCDSFAERIVDDWLHKNHIKHRKNAPYIGTKMTVDFKVGDLFIEYFGLQGASKRYNQLIERKREFCAEHGITLLEIYPDELFAGDFRKCLGKIMRAIRVTNKTLVLSR